VVTAPTPGQASWTARNRALAGPQDDTDLTLTWPYLDPEQREAEETGAKAAVTAGAPAELAAAMTETRAIRAIVAEIIGVFDAPTAQGVCIARTGEKRIDGWRKRAGLET
jgi:hypothetical protein